MKTCNPELVAESMSVYVLADALNRSTLTNLYQLKNTHKAHNQMQTLFKVLSSTNSSF